MYEIVMITGEPNKTLKRCFDCQSCRAAVTWWCTQEEAKKLNRGRVGYWLCPHWSPCLKWSDLKWYEKFFNKYIEVKQSSEEELIQAISEIPTQDNTCQS
jgi:hypothetical protein